jgi:CRISPR type I-D-associated protein Csc1
MELKAIKITLLNHLFYHTEISNGSITGGFLGDLALTYALNKSINKNAEMYEHRLKPNYKEIADFDFYITIGKPVKAKFHRKKEFYEFAGKPLRTGSYIVGTALNVDDTLALGKNLPHYNRAAKGPYKTIRNVQGVALRNEFISLLISENPIELPPTMRVGNQKETLLKLEEIPIEATDNNFWLNAYTLKVVFDNLQQAMNISIDENGSANYHYILENYALLKGFSQKQVETIFKKVF